MKNFAFCILIFASSAWAGSIKGDVRLSDARLKKTAPAIVEYHGPCGTKRWASVVRLWKDRVMDVTLWLTSKDKIVNDSPKTQDIAISGCEFRPKMVVVIPPSRVRIKNEDPNTQWLIIRRGDTEKEQIMISPDSEAIELEIKEGYNIFLSSGFYPWMEGIIKPEPQMVQTIPTAWDGRFNFKDIQPGEYTLHAWHPSLGETSQEIIVEDNETLKAEIRYNLPEKEVIPVIEATTLEEFFGTDFEEDDENPFKH